MSGSVQTTYDSLCKLVRWAHSHGTICNLIPSLQHLTHGSYGNMLTPEPDLHGSSTPVTVWGCGAGHAYHWPISDHSNSCVASANISFVGGCPSNKIGGRASCDLSCTEATSDGEEFNSRLLDIAGCDLSATDVSGDYEHRPSRKRGGIPAGAVMGKKVKQEATSAEHYETVSYVANSSRTGPAVIDSGACQAPYTHTPLLNKPIPPCLQPQQHNAAQREHQHDLGCEESDDPEMELLKRGSCTTGTTDRAERCGSATETTEKTAAAGGQNKLETLRALLCAERSHNRQMLEMISSLKQDKELLQQELTKKAELICDFLQDKLRPDTSWAHCSIQMEPGSSHLTSSDDVGRFDPSFYTFEEMELHPLEYHRALKSKRSRDGENTRVRMKNVVGVIARYMAALQEFRCSVSMKVAFDRVGVDRNTISRTAAIAELSLAAPEVFNGLAPWDEKEETLAHYAHRCRQAMDDTIKAKIKMMKAKGELLPIVSK